MGKFSASHQSRRGKKLTTPKTTIYRMGTQSKIALQYMKSNPSNLIGPTSFCTHITWAHLTKLYYKQGEGGELKELECYPDMMKLFKDLSRQINTIFVPPLQLQLTISKQQLITPLVDGQTK